MSMVLPLYLAMTGAEISAAGSVPHFAWMACHFSPYGQGLTNIPRSMPEGSMLILNDRVPCQGHSPSLVARQLAETADRFGCGSVLLDFQRTPNSESLAIIEAVLNASPCPAALSSEFAAGFDCPVFLPPCPLHESLEHFIKPWAGRELWLEAALCQEEIRITKEGSEFLSVFPPDQAEGGFYDETLRCRYTSRKDPGKVVFTLFDMPQTLFAKLENARELGITQAIGLYQQLRPHLDLYFQNSKK